MPQPHTLLSTLLSAASVLKTHAPPETLTLPLLHLLLRRPLPPHLKLSLFRLHPDPSAFPLLLSSLPSSHLDALLPLLPLLPPSLLHLPFQSFLHHSRFDSAIAALRIIHENYSSHPPEELSHQLLLAFLRRNRPSLALPLFFQLREFEVPGKTCNFLLSALRKSGMEDEFRVVFDELVKREFRFDAVGYNVCIYAFGCWGDTELALRLFREMKVKEVVPDLCTYNSVVKALCVAGRIDDVMLCYEEVKSGGFAPDEYTYRMVVQGCCATYRIADALRVFGEMEASGVRPDTVVCNSLLGGLFKARKLKEACGLFEKMVSDGVRASCCTYNVMIDGLFRNDRAEAAFVLFSDLKKKGQFVDAVSYSIVVLHMCREVMVDEALGLVEEMEARGFVVDLVTATTVLIGLHKKRRWDRAERLMKCVKNSDVVPSVLKWTADMEASLEARQDTSKDYTKMFPFKGDINDKKTWMHTCDEKSGGSSEFDGGFKDDWSLTPHMDQLAEKSSCFEEYRNSFSVCKGRRVQDKGGKTFDVDMVNTYMSIFLMRGKLSTACKLFEIFTEMGCAPVAYTYNSLLSSFVKKGYFHDAWGILQKMGENSSPGDVATYNVIIQGLGKMGKANLASAVLDELVKRGGHLDITMYNTMINALGKAKRLDEANGLFKQMKENGINPDVVTFNILIEIHAKAGKVEEAYQFLRMMLDAGCSPNHVTDTILDFLEKEIEKLRYEKASIKRDQNNVDLHT